MIQKGIDRVKEAIEADNAGDYEKAFLGYQQSLEFFHLGLKYEKNPTLKTSIMQRVEGYMKRAEDLKVSTNGLIISAIPSPS